MGYSQRFCQLCGISFNVGRIRKRGEPPEAAWSGMYGPREVVEGGFNECQGCENVSRHLPEHVYSDGSVKDAEEVFEHIAGPNCISSDGYTGWRISLEEMKGCLQVQCLAPKQEDWTEEEGDRDFERTAEFCFLTGISQGPPDGFDIENLEPIRHGVQHAMISNGEMLMDDCTIPFHPHCFTLFERLSQERLGKIDIDGLWRVTVEQPDPHLVNRYENFPESHDVKHACQQFYEAIPGTEYLAAHPLEVPGLDKLVKNCIISGQVRQDTAFSQPKHSKAIADAFSCLSAELKTMVLLELDKEDVANLRLASASFVQLSQTYFHSLVQSEMPWVWEVKELQGKQVDWYQLWCKLSQADGGSGKDEAKRRQLYEAKMTEYHVRTLESLSCAMPKPSELRGLRNRRRIYGDIQLILDRIANLHENDSNAS